MCLNGPLQGSKGLEILYQSGKFGETEGVDATPIAVWGLNR